MKTKTNRGQAPIQPADGEKFFTKPEMARLLKVSIRTVTQMMRRGDLPYLKLNGCLVRFRLEDVNRRLNETSLCCDAGPGKGRA